MEFRCPRRKKQTLDTTHREVEAPRIPLGRHISEIRSDRIHRAHAARPPRFVGRGACGIDRILSTLEATYVGTRNVAGIRSMGGASVLRGRRAETMGGLGWGGGLPSVRF